MVHSTNMNVPDAVDFGDGRRIEWTWTVTGEKLARVTLDDQGATAAKRYAGGFVYRETDGSGLSAEVLDHFGPRGDPFFSADIPPSTGGEPER